MLVGRRVRTVRLLKKSTHGVNFRRKLSIAASAWETTYTSQPGFNDTNDEVARHYLQCHMIKTPPPSLTHNLSSAFPCPPHVPGLNRTTLPLLVRANVPPTLFLCCYLSAPPCSKLHPGYTPLTSCLTKYSRHTISIDGFFDLEIILGVQVKLHLHLLRPKKRSTKCIHDSFLLSLQIEDWLVHQSYVYTYDALGVTPLLLE